MPSRPSNLRPPLAFALALFVASFAFAPARADPGAPALLVVGDSVSAGYGVPKGAGWVDLLAARLESERLAWRVVNASITGDTTAGGRMRLPALLAQHRPGIVVVELGGNDGLRGGSLKATRDNLDAMVGAIAKSGAKAVVVGMKLPPNYGPAYTREFESIFPDVAKAHKAALVPFLFAGFGDSAEWFQPDRVHPTERAQQTLLDNVWPALKPLAARQR